MNELKAFWKKEGSRLNAGGGDWLAIMRAGTGITLMAKIISEYNILGLLYGSHALVPPEVSSLSSHDLFPTLLGLSHMVCAWWTEDTALRVFFGIGFVFSALMIVGLCTRVSALICWLFQLTVMNSSDLTSYGSEFLLQSLLFYSLIFPTGRYRSLDSLLHDGSYPVDPLLPYYHLTIQIHICIIYLATGAAKAVMPTWHDGSYLWSVTSHPQFATLSAPLARTLLSYGHSALILSWFVVILEIAYPIGIWFRRLARPLLIFILLMHAYIAVAIGLWIFGWLMIVFNLAAFGDVLMDEKPGSSIARV